MCKMRARINRRINLQSSQGKTIAKIRRKWSAKIVKSQVQDLQFLQLSNLFRNSSKE